MSDNTVKFVPKLDNNDLNPPMPPGLITRDADNARGLLWIAEACGPPWPERAHAALVLLLKKDTAKQ